MHNLDKTELHYHRTDINNARPVTRRTSPKKGQNIAKRKQIKELLENGLIEPSTSEWRSPVGC